MSSIVGKEPFERVLVVDDSPEICTVISDMLEGAPVRAECVHSDRDAHAALRTAPPFRGLILDVNLGKGTTGFDVARLARRLIPQIAVIFISGEASSDSWKACGVEDSSYLRKPFSQEDLLSALHLLLQD
jgi:CheY-like chemotaxis protein